MTVADYLPILIQIILALGMGVSILIASHLFGQRGRRNKTKDSPYECGVISESKIHPRFSVKFYVIAMLFIVFDIEVIFLIPWALVYREFLQTSIPILIPGMVFIGILVIGLVYELKKGALQWEK